MVVVPASRRTDFELGTHLQPQQRVQIRERLVHEQHWRLDRERARHRDALALPARELRGIALEIALDVQQLRRALHSALDALAIGALCAQAERDVLEHVMCGKTA